MMINIRKIIQDKLSENTEEYQIGNISMKYFKFPRLSELKAYYLSKTNHIDQLSPKGTIKGNMGGIKNDWETIH